MESGLNLRALATDFDGTLAHDGTVNAATTHALDRLKRAGFLLILVTGRELNDLRAIFPNLTWFDLAVLENGASSFIPARALSRPSRKRLRRISPPAFASAESPCIPAMRSSPPGNNTKNKCSK